MAVAALDAVVLDAVLASLAVLFAIVVLQGSGAPRAPGRFLAAFLLLIAANAGATAVQLQMPSGSGAALAWFRAATVFATLDPLFLFAFAATYGPPSRLHRALPIGAVAAVSAVLALLAVQVRIESAGYHAALALFTAVAYGAALARFARPLVTREPLPGARLLAAGLCFASVAVWARFGVHAMDVAGLRQGAAALAAYLPAVLGTMGVLGYGMRLPGRDDRRALALAALAGLALTLVVVPDFTDLLSAWFLGAPKPQWLHHLAAASSALRWTLFALLASAAVVRHSFLGLGLGARRALARLVVALGFVLAAAGALLALEALLGGTALSPVGALALLVALAASQGFRGGVDLVASRLYGVPVGRDLAADLETYRAALEEAGSGSPEHAARLGRLRAELGIDSRTARVVERMAEAPGGPVRTGGLVAGRYRVGRLLGRGTFGRAFLARDELLERDVALKEVLEDAPGQADAVLREARIAGGVAHPNVVAVHDVLRLPRSVVVVAEFIPGGSLEERLAAGPMPPAEAFRVADGVLAGLAAVHASGVIHRDLKPANILLGAAGDPKLADFGTARVRRGGTAADGVLVGTPEFMSPEQRRGEPATAASDLYAAGLVVRACFGPRPPRGVAAVLRRALEEDPRRRFPSAEAMRSALRGAGAASPGRAAARGPRR